ncbi:MAG: 7-carboxy-7-deazaguanine synthase QueE [Acidiferrobacteraceae bacterium]|jgi:7-carboxy-7-deazaguanine synthase
MSTSETRARERVRVTEIFHSVQGEARSAGWPTVFVRLTGCPLRCGYCDTEYAFTGGHWMSYDDILSAVAPYGTRYITVTGGEPLAQTGCPDLLRRLCDHGYHVSLETSGALDIEGIDPRVNVVMDIKTPGSGEVARNRFENLAHLDKNDEIKFVITSREDYLWSREQVEARNLDGLCDVLFSPAEGLVNPRELAEWILEDHLPVRMQVQLHKILWGNEPGR